MDTGRTQEPPRSLVRQGQGPQLAHRSRKSRQKANALPFEPGWDSGVGCVAGPFPCLVADHGPAPASGAPGEVDPGTTPQTVSLLGSAVGPPPRRLALGSVKRPGPRS